MKKAKTALNRNLLAKAASLVLAIAIWFLIDDLLTAPNGSRLDAEDADILGPAINPALQNTPPVVDETTETPTVH